LGEDETLAKYRVHAPRTLLGQWKFPVELLYIDEKAVMKRHFTLVLRCCVDSPTDQPMGARSSTYNSKFQSTHIEAPSSV